MKKQSNGSDSKILNSQFLSILIVAGIMIYLALLAFNSLTRTRHFSPDSMNYVDVAQNIISGRGISQSTLGYAQVGFSADDTIPVAQTSQPFGYPMLIALLGLLGIPGPDAALLISAISLGLILLFGFLLAEELFDSRAALLSITLLLLYFPLSRVSRYAWSEPPGSVFVLVTLWLLARAARVEEHLNWLSLAAGLMTGLAFSTRYAFWPLFIVGFLFLIIELRGWQKIVLNLALYSAGFVLPAGLILVRNHLSIGAVLPSQNASQFGLLLNIKSLINALLGSYVDEMSTSAAIALIVTVVVFLILIYTVRNRNIDIIPIVFFQNRRYLLTTWSAAYMAAIIIQFSITHYGSINTRHIAPVGITIIILFSGLIVEALQPGKRLLQLLALIILVFVTIREIRISITLPEYDTHALINSSDRLRWIKEQTTENDLIMGTNTVDIPFYFNRPAAVSFTFYPYSDRVSYELLSSFSRNHCHEYEHTYLILSGPLSDEHLWERLYGPDITDLVFGRLEQYPDLSLIQQLSDTHIYEFDCPGSDPATNPS